MAIEFVNPLTAGTVLVRSDIRSQNYAAGSAGWIIEADGDAEFNSVVIRGGVVVSGLALYYDGTPAAGNLIMSIAAADGTDAYGNTYVEGTTVYDADGSQLQIVSGAGASMVLTPSDLAGTTWLTGLVATTTGASSRPGLLITSPADSVHTAAADIILFGGGPTTTDTSIFMGADRVSLSGNLEIPTGVISSYSSWTTFTPQWNNVGTATFSRNVGWWKRVDDLYVYEIYAAANAAGSGTTNVTISNLPFNPYRAGGGAATTRQMLPGHCGAVSAGTNSSVSGTFAAQALAGGAANTLDRLAGPTDLPLRGENISNTFVATFQGSMRAV